MRNRGTVGLALVIAGVLVLFLTHPSLGSIIRSGKHTTDIAVRSGPATERLADSMAASLYGWTGSQKDCLNLLWGRETGGTWDPLITDAITINGHNAFGIAQALHHDPSGTHAVSGVTRHFLDGHTDKATVDEYPDISANAGNAAAQIRWGLGYIQGTYSTPCGAWNGTNHDANGY